MEEIKVVSTQKALTDLLRLGPDEVKAKVEELVPPSSTEAVRQSYLMLIDIVNDYREFRAKLPVSDGLETILARQLLYSDHVYPYTDPKVKETFEVRSGRHKNMVFTSPPVAGADPVSYARAIGPGSMSSITGLKVGNTVFTQEGKVDNLNQTGMQLRRLSLWEGETNHLRKISLKKKTKSRPLPILVEDIFRNVDPKVKNLLEQLFPNDSALHAGMVMAVGLGVLPIVRRVLSGQDISEFLECHQEAIKTQEVMRRVQEEFHAQVAKARQYLVIIEEKLGTKRSQEIITEIRKNTGQPEANNPEDVLSACTKRERELVTTEYNSRELLWKAHLNNKCGHLPLAFRLRRAVSTDQMLSTFDKLKHYFAPGHKNQNQMIPCRNCSFPTICPHVVEWVQLMKENAPQSTFHRRLREYADPLPLAGSRVYFCKICNEQLAHDVSTRAPGKQFGMFGDFREDGQNEMWGAIVRLLDPKDANHKILLYDQVVHVTNMATNIVSDIFPLVLSFRSKNKLNAQQAKLVMITYVYAAVFNLVISRTDDEHALKIRVNGAPNNAKPAELAKRMLQNLQKIYGGLIKLAEATFEQVSRQFKDAYVDILKYYGRQIITVQNTAAILLQTIMTCDPIYHYLKVTAARKGDLDQKKLDQFEFLVGFKMHDYLRRKPDKRYATFMAASLAGIGSVQLPIGLEPEFSHTQPEMLFYRDMYGAREKKGGREQVSIADMAFRQFVLFNTKRANKEQLAAYEKGQAALLQAEERELHKWRIQILVAAHGQVIGGGHLPYFKYPAPLTSLYDEDGNKHIWGTFVYRSGKQTKEFSRKEAASRPSGWKYVSTKCSICNATLGETSKLDLAKTTESLKAKSAIGHLLAMYTVKCPEEGLHEFEKGHCRKCRMPVGLLTPTDASLSEPAAVKFFRKYSSTIQVEKVDMVLKPPQITQLVWEDVKFTFDRTAITEASKIAGVHVNELLNLGDAEGRPQAEMKAPPRDVYSSGRALRVRKWFYQCVLRFCQAVFSKDKPHKWLENLPKSNYVARPDEIRGDFDDKFANLFEAQKYKDATLLGIQRIAEALVAIANPRSKFWEETPKDPQILSKHILLNIVRGDQMFCLAGAFDFKLLMKEVDVTQLTYDEAADVGEDMTFQEEFDAVSAQYDGWSIDKEFVKNPFDIVHDVEEGSEETNYEPTRED